MAPSGKEVEQALIDGTCRVFEAEPDATTVNKVRKEVEQHLNVEEGFLSSDSWKSKSKNLIKQYVEKLLDGWQPEKKEASVSKAGKKRLSAEAETPPKPKRAKRTASKPVKAEDSDQSEEEKKTVKKRKSVSKPQAKEASESEDDAGYSNERPAKSQTKKRKVSDVSEIKVNSLPKIDLDSEEDTIRVKNTIEEDELKKKLNSDSEEENTKFKSKSPSSLSSPNKYESDSEDDLKSSITAITNGRAIGGLTEKAPKKKETVMQGADADEKTVKAQVKTEKVKPEAVEEEEEYSDVIDEGPKPKRKGQGSGDAKVKKEKKPSETTTKKIPSSAADDPDEAEMKKLQAQLAKCGIRKIWHMELKKHGDDSRSKIRHLRKLLTEIGMEGRFSEAKAREIRETRELLAEAEAAQEMNALWGVETEGRASRSKVRKSVKAEHSEDDEDEGKVKAGDDYNGENGKKEDDNGDDDDDDMKDEDEETIFAARKRRAHADLAFLGDDSDSD